MNESTVWSKAYKYAAHRISKSLYFVGRETHNLNEIYIPSFIRK